MYKLKGLEKMNEYDVIVVGAGHAGIEASLACARLGLKTGLFTIYLNTIALMSCNPSIGGPGKSHLVSEIGMLGGQMAKHIDRYNLQLKNLNHTKGLAARIIRAQADKYEYRVKTEQMLDHLEKKEYQKAMDIAESIDWRRVKNASMLNTVSEIYEYNGEFKKGRDILFLAFDRAPGSRKIVYR